MPLTEYDDGMLWIEVNNMADPEPRTCQFDRRNVAAVRSGSEGATDGQS